jgi:hypothetical protein
VVTNKEYPVPKKKKNELLYYVFLERNLTRVSPSSGFKKVKEEKSSAKKKLFR